LALKTPSDEGLKIFTVLIGQGEDPMPAGDENVIDDDEEDDLDEEEDEDWEDEDEDEGDLEE
jgi:hypothetical protein